MLIIPIGQEGALARMPCVTIGLIAVNVLIHLYTGSVVPEQLERRERAAEDYAGVLRELRSDLDAQDYQNGRSIDVPDIGLNHGASFRGMSEFHERRQHEVEEAMESGELHPVGSKEHDHWLAARKKAQETSDAILYNRIGFTPARPSFFGLFACMFFHGGFLHLIGNMIFLWAAGCMMECTWGRGIYLIAYVLSGVAATVSHWVMAAGSEIPCIGASGAIAGMMGACLIAHASSTVRAFWMYFLGFTFRCGVSSFPVWILLGMWIIGQITAALVFSGMDGVAGVAYWAHIGGFVFGAIITGMFSIWVRVSDNEGDHKETDIVDDSLGARPIDRAPRESRPVPSVPEGGPRRGDPGFEQQPVAESSVKALGKIIPVDASIAEAEAEYRQNHRHEACRLLEKLTRGDGGEPAAHSLMAKILAEEWAFEKARRHGERAVDGYCRKGSALQAAQTIEELEQAGIRQPVSAGCLFNVGCALETDGADRQAAKLFHHLLSTFPDGEKTVRAGLKAARLFERTGAVDRAKDCYARVEELARDEASRDRAVAGLRALGVRVES